MKVTSVQNVIGWVYDKLQIENRKTYHYDRGNDVTVVERRSRTITSLIYDRKGQLNTEHAKGIHSDKKV